MVQWLPDKQWYEFAYHKFYNPEVDYNEWQPWDEWTYPERDVSRFKNIIADQVQHIEGKRVLDLACHLGYTSLFCLHNGASHVTGTNVRQRELDIGAEICTHAGYTNFEFLYSNLYNTQELLELCNNHDTVFFTGVLYHLNNHYQILETLCSSSAKTIVIESKVPMNDYEYNCEKPLIIWNTEKTNSHNGWYYDQPSAFIGTPNTAWILQALQSLNMNVIYNQAIEYLKASESMTRRVTITATHKLQ
jgi:ubiquinone/menaquinone biosynthesis C-methylase UbiE